VQEYEPAGPDGIRNLQIEKQADGTLILSKVHRPEG
tara:strand:- start:1861 stop:1968 length:108 start_codon:yes stop_codon:yes gene_type:complete